MFNVEYLIDDVPLFHPKSYWWLEDDIPVGLDLQRRGVNMVVAGRDGSVGGYNETTETVQLGLKMIVNAVGDVSLADSYAALMGLVNKRSGPLRLTRRVFGKETVTDAKLAAITETKRIETGDSIRLTIVLTLPNVYFRDFAWSDWKMPGLVTNNIYVVDTLDGSAVDIRDAQITLTGPMIGPKLTDIGSGNTVSVGSIAAGREVCIDAATGYAYERAHTLYPGIPNAGNDVTSQIVTTGPDSYKNVFCMSPWMYDNDPFTRQIRVRITATGMTIDSSVLIHARRCFL